MNRALFNVSEFFARSTSSGLSDPLVWFIHKHLPQDFCQTNQVRRFVDNLHPVDPLGGERADSLPAIELLLASKAKDFSHVSRVLRSVSMFSRNPITRTMVLVPEKDLALARQHGWGPNVEVVGEDHFLPPRLLEAADRFGALGRRGWIIQQLLGLYGAWTSEAPGVLVVDSDTTLLAARTWLTSEGVQALSFSHEYRVPYESHCRAIWGDRVRHHDFSYVTHYMLMQPDIVRAIFPSLDHFELWLEMADLTETSPVADYHSYGRWIADNCYERVRMSRWRNKASLDLPDFPAGPEMQVKWLQQRHKSFLSVSSHSYLKG